VSVRAGKRPPSYIAAFIALVVALVAAILFVVVYGAVMAFTASDRYGSVPMPGRETLELPQGDVTVYFQEGVQLRENENLRPPSDLRVQIRGSEAGPSLRVVRSGTSSQVGGGFGERVSIGDIDVPEEGDYVVAVAPTKENRVDPAIVLGDDVFDGFGDAIPVGLLILVVGVGAAALIAVITFVRRRRLSETGPTLRQ
jgi:hypothetical protein